MPNTCTQIYIQYLFTVKENSNKLQKPWRDDVFKFISGIIKGKGQKSIIVNGVHDHVHVFVGLTPDMAISDLIRDIKNNSTNFINKNHFVKGTFAWQEGYGAFSYPHSAKKNVYNYIHNQEEHHKKISFKDEYLAFLRKFEIQYDERYLFRWLE